MCEGDYFVTQLSVVLYCCFALFTCRVRVRCTGKVYTCFSSSSVAAKSMRPSAAMRLLGEQGSGGQAAKVAHRGDRREIARLRVERHAIPGDGEEWRLVVEAVAPSASE